MSLIPIFVAAFLGLILAQAGHALLGMGLGAALGFLFSKVTRLETQLRELQRREAAPPLKDAPISLAASMQPAPQASPVEISEAPAHALTAGASPAAGLSAPQKESRPAAVSKTPPRTSPVDIFLASAKQWLTTGNVPVKVGIIVLFFGIAFLFKYAVEHRVLVLPIELRLFGVAVLAGVIFAFGWKLRNKSSVYALNLQGAGIGILYLTIYAAFRLYSLLPGPAAFALLVLLTVASGMLAVRQDSRGLAAFASIGGFLAPLLASTGQGSHVALFSYYLLINLAILGISWFRAWRSLNLIGFAFTFGVGTYWGFEFYTPELYGSIQPFLILNFLFYQAIAILYAFRQPPRLRGLVDGSIIFGTPAMVFALQTQLVPDTEWGLAISAGLISLYYASVATWLHRRHTGRMELLTQSMIVLAVGFATIAVPLALDDRWSAIAWALEGAGVVWLGVRQTSIIARLTGTLLIVCSAWFYLEHGWRHDAGLAVINGNVLGGLIISYAAIFAARLLATDTRKMRWQPIISVCLLIWGAIWWLGTGMAEISDRTRGDLQADLFVAFNAASFTLPGLFSHYRGWVAARRLLFAFLPILLFLVLIDVIDNDHLFGHWGSIVWLFALAVHFLLLRFAENGDTRTLFTWHVAGTFLVVTVLALEATWRVRSFGLNEVWRVSAALLMPLLTSMALLFFRQRVLWPLQRHWSAYRSAAAMMVAWQLVFFLKYAIGDPGDPAPMTYIPLLNPFDLLTVFGLGIGYWVYRVWQADVSAMPAWQTHVAGATLGGFAFALTTLMVIRGMHQFGDVVWNEFALRRSVSVQSALSIYWAMLGFSGMIFGTRQARYWIWNVGVGLMVIVVLKLFFVDLGNTGTVARIISFLGVGGLLMVVGYFAPRPPLPGNASTA